MTNYLKITTILFTLAFTNKLFSQWYKLPAISSLPSYTAPPTPPMSMTYPVEILPVGDNTIVWTMSALVSPSSGGYINSYVSKNDLSLSSCIETCNYSNSSFGCCGIKYLTGFNDSVYTYVTTYQGWYTQAFKLGNSQTLQGVTCPNNNSIIHLVNVTNSCAYAATQIDNINDSLLIVRTLSASPKVQFINKLSLYITNDTKKLFFINDSVGYLSALYRNNNSKQVLLKTINYGTSWFEIYLDSVNTIMDYDFPTENIGYLTKNNGTVLKTIDGGINWTSTTNPGISSPNCIKFADTQIGYIAGDINMLMKTIDGGINWTTINSGTSNTIKSVQTFGNIAYFVDSSKDVYKNQSPAYVKENYKENELKIFPIPSNGTFNITDNNMTFNELNIELYNILGEIIYKTNETISGKSFSKDISLNNISSGTYFVVVKNGDKAFKQKLIVSKN